MNIPRVPILGVSVSALNMELTLAQIHAWLKDESSAYVCVAPAHSVMECVNDPELLPVFNEAGLVTPDGMSIVWLLRARGYKNVQRVYGPDLLLSACEYGLSNHWKHYFYGGLPGVAEKMAAKLQDRFIGLQIAGVCSPPFGKPSVEEEKALLAAINASGADILWVGMSSPWQEIWMHEHLGQINVQVMVGVGAAFDYLSGSKVQAPRWIQRSGFEWLYRLLKEPKRLWPRYKQYPRFFILALKELLFSKSAIPVQKK